MENTDTIQKLKELTDKYNYKILPRIQDIYRDENYPTGTESMTEQDCKEKLKWILPVFRELVLLNSEFFGFSLKSEIPELKISSDYVTATSLHSENIKIYINALEHRLNYLQGRKIILKGNKSVNLAIFAMALTIGAACLPYLITPERDKRMIEEVASTAMRDSVKLGDIQLRIEHLASGIDSLKAAAERMEDKSNQD